MCCRGSSVFLARMIPFTFLGPVVGWMADRFDRLTLMLICDLARAALILVLTVLDDNVSLPFLLLVKLLASALAAQFDPCRSAVMPVVRAHACPCSFARRDWPRSPSRVAASTVWATASHRLTCVLAIVRADRQ